MDFCTPGSCEFLCTCQHGAAAGHPLCIYFWPAAGSSSLTGVCFCERVSEVTTVGIQAFTCSHSILFSQPLRCCQILVQSVTEDVLLNLDPHICSIEAVLWPGYLLGFLTQEYVISESNTQPGTLMKCDMSGSDLSLLR